MHNVVFAGIHRLKQNTKAQLEAGSKLKNFDPIAPVALEISKDFALLCLDEFQVCYINIIMWILFINILSGILAL